MSHCTNQHHKSCAVYQFTLIGENVYYSTDFLIQLVEMVYPNEAYFSSSNKLPALVVMGEGAKGIVLPVNIKKEEAE